MIGRLLAVVAMSPLFAACAVVMPVPDAGIAVDELDLQPRPGQRDALGEAPTGPVMELVRGTVAGERFSLTAHASRDGACTWMEREMSGGGGCGALPGEGPGGGTHFGMIGLGGGDGSPAEVTGLVSAAVRSVVVETDAGPAAATLVSLEPAEIEAQLFIAFVPGDAVVEAVVALDGAGAEIGRIDVGTPLGPGRDGGVPPTPDAP